MTTSPTPDFKLDPMAMSRNVPLGRAGTQEVCFHYRFFESVYINSHRSLRIWRVLFFFWQARLELTSTARFGWWMVDGLGQWRAIINQPPTQLRNLLHSLDNVFDNHSDFIYNIIPPSDSRINVPVANIVFIYSLTTDLLFTQMAGNTWNETNGTLFHKTSVLFTLGYYVSIFKCIGLTWHSLCTPQIEYLQALLKLAV